MSASGGRRSPGISECDVLVIGAGPAGSAAARAAAEGGASVIMVDRRRSIGVRPQCAGFLPAAAAGLIPMPAPGVINRVSGMITFISGRESVETPSPGFIIHRDRFDQELAAAAAASGVKIMTGTRALGHAGGLTTLSSASSRRRIRSAVTIGADGPKSTVGTWIGSVNSRFVTGVQWTVPLRVELAQTRVYFSRRFPGGYGWIFPARSQARVGVGVDRAVGVKPLEALKWFVCSLEDEGLVEARALSVTGGLIPVGGPREAVRGTVVLAGDAAGLCHPVSGAGIAQALQSGTLAGEAAARFAKEGDGSALDAYAAKIEVLFGEALKAAVSRRRRMYADAEAGDDGYQDAIMAGWL